MYHLDISKKNISDIFKISDVTISKTYRRIHPFHKIITNNEITNLVLEKKKSKPKKISELTNNTLVKNKDYLSESEESMDEVDSEVDNVNSVNKNNTLEI